MQYCAAGNYDDYGFLSSKGLAFAASHESQPTFRSVEDLLAHSNGIIKSESSGTKPDVVRNEGLRTGCMSRKMSSSQPNLRKCKANDNWNIKVRFDTENLHTEAPSTLKCKKNSKKTRKYVKQNIHASRDEDKPRSWWKSIFSSKKKSESQDSNVKAQHPKQLTSIKNDSADLLKRVVEDEVDIGTHSLCQHGESLPDLQFQILELAKSPCLHKRMTDEVSTENGFPPTNDTNDCCDRNTSHTGQNATTTTKQHTRNKRRSRKSNKKIPNNNAVGAMQKPATSTKSSPKITPNKKSSKSNQHTTTQKTIDGEGLALDVENSSKDAIQQTCSEKYRVNKTKEKKVLVHIQTK